LLHQLQHKHRKQHPKNNAKKLQLAVDKRANGESGTRVFGREGGFHGSKRKSLTTESMENTEARKID
jgi:hypothetical protein